MPIPKCTNCGRVCWTCATCRNRSYCEFCNSCNLHGQDEPTPEMIRAPREPRGRMFLVQVAFLTKRGWSETFEVRVHAKGLAGAIWRGLRQARCEHLKKRTRVQQARVTVIAA